VRSGLFLVICLIVGAAIFATAVSLNNDYYFFAGYVVLQYVVLATAWNILGGYCGYVNFGSAAFFALRCRFRFWSSSAGSCPASSGLAWAI
jgi:branched-chain amino acid transport system permease protein